MSFDDIIRYLLGQQQAPKHSPIPVPAPYFDMRELDKEPLIDEKMLRDAIQEEFPRFKVQQGGVHGRKDITI